MLQDFLSEVGWPFTKQQCLVFLFCIVFRCFFCCCWCCRWGRNLQWQKKYYSNTDGFFDTAAFFDSVVDVDDADQGIDEYEYEYDDDDDDDDDEDDDEEEAEDTVWDVPCRHPANQEHQTGSQNLPEVFALQSSCKAGMCFHVRSSHLSLPF